MRKIVTLFERNFDGDKLVRDEVTKGAEWVIAGEGRATRKIDGTCCMIRDGKLYRRFEVKPNDVPPRFFEAAGPVDRVTGKQQGWVPVGDGPNDRWHREAYRRDLPNGTYELVGPKIQGNPEGVDEHILVLHGSIVFPVDPPRTFAGLVEWFKIYHDSEGIVWHRDNGDMVKIKMRDFGLKRYSRKSE